MNQSEKSPDDDFLFDGLHWDPDAPKSPKCVLGVDISLADYCAFINSFPDDPSWRPNFAGYKEPFHF